MVNKFTKAVLNAAQTAIRINGLENDPEIKAKMAAMQEAADNDDRAALKKANEGFTKLVATKIMQGKNRK